MEECTKISNNCLSCLHIIPGYYCNFTCAHCATNSGPNKTIHLNANELEIIKQNINDYLFEKIIFSGGEPTFYINKINTILSNYKYL